MLRLQLTIIFSSYKDPNISEGSLHRDMQITAFSKTILCSEIWHKDIIKLSSSESEAWAPVVIFTDK